MDKRQSQQILGMMSHWRVRFEEGQVRHRGFRQPRLYDSERFAVRFNGVVVNRQQDSAISIPLWSNPPRRVFRGLRPQSAETKVFSGILWATSQRAFVVGSTPTHVLTEWLWREQTSVELLPTPLGVVIRRTPDVLSDIAVSRWNTDDVPSKPTLLVIKWLKVAGAFADSNGNLNAWFDALPETLAQV